MSTIAAIAERLRTAIAAKSVSFREISRRADLSDSTIRGFVRTGNADIRTVVQIERAVASLSGGAAAGDKHEA